MTKIEKIRTLTDDELISLCTEFDSASAILVHLIGSFKDPRCRKVLRSRVDGLGIEFYRNNQVSDEEFTEFVKNSICLSDVVRLMGLSVQGSNGKTIKNRIKRLNLDTSHFDLGKAISRGGNTYSKEQIFCKNSTYTRSNLKKVVLKHNLIPYECSTCDIYHQYGPDLVLQLDHENGINNDNRVENLRFLCPNCHTLTETYGGKNKNIRRGMQAVKASGL